MDIEPPDIHFLRAAEGWVELGDWREAEAELGRMRAELQGHPAVLAMRFRIFATAKDWQRALEVGEALVFDSVNATGEGDMNTLHAGLPPASGIKWLLSQWIREKAQPVA